MRNKHEAETAMNQMQTHTRGKHDSEANMNQRQVKPEASRNQRQNKTRVKNKTIVAI